MNTQFLCEDHGQGIWPNPVTRLISEFMVSGRPLNVERLRAYCPAGCRQVATAIRLADHLGVKVIGPLRFDEQRELAKTS
jgi:hypothetical protein